MTADEKRKVLADWLKFLNGGLKIERFTERLYTHLIMHYEYIAHYSRQGFYEVYFSDPEATLRFLDQFDREKGCVSTESGMILWIRNGNDICQGYYDLNNAMIDALAPLLPNLHQSLEGDTLRRAEQRMMEEQKKVAELRLRQEERKQK